MGSSNAAGMAEAVNDGLDLSVALSWHLTSNHYPPLPHEYVEVAKQVIEALREDPTINEPIPLPEVALIPRQATRDEDGLWCRAWDLVEALHLDSFLDQGE